ncbi:MAG: transposase [Bacteroidales bacterium]|nr:transposase [Bacteroidales bacterium]MCD8395516.1 transposase [Bacteroidales bacterium]
MDLSLFLDRDEDTNEFYRKIPHWHQPDKLQFVTFRLGDSLPQPILRELKEQKQRWMEDNPEPWTPDQMREYHNHFTQKVDRWLDQGYGACYLGRKEVANYFVTKMLEFHSREWCVWAYVVMPNHVHLLLQAINGENLRASLGRFLNITSHEINKMVERKGTLWQREPFDRIVRNEGHYINVLRYMGKNVDQGGV